MSDVKQDFKILLKYKYLEMYNKNKISKNDIHELDMYDQMYKKAFINEKNYKEFNKFELREIERGTEFLEIDKEEYQMNGYAQEIAEYFFSISEPEGD